MSDNTFAVVFSGQLVEGAGVEKVQANFAQLFKVDIAKVVPMFAGKPVAIKKGLDEATAKKYQAVLRQAGAVCQVVNLTAAPPTVPVVPSVTTPTPVPLTASAQPPAPQAVASTTALNATLAAPGALMAEPEQVTPLQVDISGLSMGAVGETLVAAQPVKELQVDVSGLSMAEPGVQLVPPSEVKELIIDLSTLSMAEPGVVLKEPEVIEVPRIDTSGITLA